MTEEQVKKIARAVVAQMMELDSYRMFIQNMERYRKELAETPESHLPAWVTREMAKAKALGICDGSRPLDIPSRAEVASMVARAAK